MKVNVPGKTPMERLTNLTKRIIAVPKQDIDEQAKLYEQRKRQRRARKSR